VTCTVVIATADVLTALQERVASFGGEILGFNDAQALQALDTVSKRKPAIVAFERMFATTPRGAALINRIKADPKLTQTEVRVVAHDSDYVRVSPRQRTEAQKALDQRGTRRAPRFKMADKTGISIDGNAGSIIDLSSIGAQVVSTAGLKPNQDLRLTLTDGSGNVRFNGKVAWASFEIPPNSGPRYRAGLEFVDADPAAVEAFCHRHKA
jgi:NAD(P)-dependent dehydrogenase (short-subunit alcohol dehydrogenase family)